MKNNLFPLEKQKKTFNFKKFEKEYHNLKSWGILTSIDLKKCNPKIFKSYHHLKKYLHDLTDVIKMRRFGDPTIITFGEDDEVLGHSMTQFIETSLISGHFVDETNSGFIDIFSCKVYNPMAAATFTQDYFEAESCNVGVIFRD
ncbi:MAG: S-adenosylmethionine decarboxylase [Alphaproteobacteria bacterium]|nr:S-adenosylmethionine decarboxylase [Alphaproteobacteria bacterium]